MEPFELVLANISTLAHAYVLPQVRTLFPVPIDRRSSLILYRRRDRCPARSLSHPKPLLSPSHCSHIKTGLTRHQLGLAFASAKKGLREVALAHHFIRQLIARQFRLFLTIQDFSTSSRRIVPSLREKKQ